MIAATLAALVLAAAGAPTLPVSAAAGCTVAPTRTELVAGAWACTITAAERVALPGDTVAVAAGTYPQAKITASGTETAPIVVSAVPGTVTVAAGSGGSALGISGVSDVQISGLDITGGFAQGVWVNASQRISLTSLTVSGSAVHGVQVNNSQDIAITSSTITANQSTGIMETGSDSGDVYTDDIVSDNGTGGPQYLGSGIEVGGTGTQIVGCTITRQRRVEAVRARRVRRRGRRRLEHHRIDHLRLERRGCQGRRVERHDFDVHARERPTGRVRERCRRHPLAGADPGSFRDGLVVAHGSTLLSQSVVSNDAVGYGKQARAAFVYGGGRLHVTASTLLLRGNPVKPTRAP